MKQCFLFGHRDATDKIFPLLRAAIERCITEYKVQFFVVGHYGGFDRLAAAALTNAKKAHPAIQLYLLTPYHPAERRVILPKGFDGAIFPEGQEETPRKYAIIKANHTMVDSSEYVIAYVQYPASNSFKLLEYAKRREKREQLHIIRIAAPDEA